MLLLPKHQRVNILIKSSGIYVALKSVMQYGSAHAYHMGTGAFGTQP